MTDRTHYEVLGVAPNATADQIREAYRRRARQHHPDRIAAADGGRAPSSGAMPAINEAYRVLGDPGRRAVYDASLRTGSTPRDLEAEAYAEASAAAAPTPVRPLLPPPKVPWRTLGVVGLLAVVGFFLLSVLTEPAEPAPPDGILRSGDCVVIEGDNDAREVACTGTDDLVVRALVAFDGTCPTGSEPHRDRQGMGIACIAVPR